MKGIPLNKIMRAMECDVQVQDFIEDCANQLGLHIERKLIGSMVLHPNNDNIWLNDIHIGKLSTRYHFSYEVKNPLWREI